jgi:hypothetical protein
LLVGWLAGWLVGWLLLFLFSSFTLAAFYVERDRFGHTFGVILASFLASCW